MLNKITLYIALFFVASVLGACEQSDPPSTIPENEGGDLHFPDTIGILRTVVLDKWGPVQTISAHPRIMCG